MIGTVILIVICLAFLAMAWLEAAVISKSITLGGNTFNEATNVTANGSISKSYSLPSAQPPGTPMPQPASISLGNGSGAGTFVMANNPHGIVVGMVVDVYWIDSSGVPRVCYNAAVATVNPTTTTTGPTITTTGGITTGVGSPLPAITTSVTVSVSSNFLLSVIGDNLTMLFANCVPSDGATFARCVITFSATGTSGSLTLHVTAGAVYQWYFGSPNPLLGDTVTSVTVSHSSETAAQTVQVSMLTN